MNNEIEKIKQETWEIRRMVTEGSIELDEKIEREEKKVIEQSGKR